jgi:hypothetical protein
VAARVERGGDLTGLRAGLGHEAVHQRALAGARRAEHQRGLAFEPLAQIVQAVVGFQAERQHGEAHVPVRGQPRPGSLERRAQIVLVEHNQRCDARGFGCDQGARELHVGEHRLGRQQHQHLVQVGCEGFGAEFVLAVEQVAAFFHTFDHALVATERPAHAIAHHHRILLAPRVAEGALAVVAFDETVSAMRGHHPPGKPSAQWTTSAVRNAGR